MRAVITFKLGEETTMVHTRHYDLETADAEMLKGDFLAFLNGGASALRGASYKYTDVDTRQAKELVVRFDYILHIELMPTPGTLDSGSLAGASITGPLTSRLGGTGPIEGGR